MIYTGVEGSICGGTLQGGRPAAAGGRRDGAIVGVTGSIRWHHYTAGAIEGYTVTRSADGQRWGLTATVVLSDAFKMAQTPLTFAALRTKHGVDGHTVVKSEWRWPILAILARTEHALTARLGPPSEEE